MPSRDISDLVPQMEEKAKLFVKKCAEKGVVIMIYCTTRTLDEQARLFRQGRTYLQIKNKINSLRKRGFYYLAEIIEEVGPQSSIALVTNAGPGESFHNLAEAFDAVPLGDDGKALWSIKNNKDKWETMFDVGAELKLEVGGRWKKFPDGPHFQLRSGGNPTKIYSPEKLKEILIENKMLTVNN